MPTGIQTKLTPSIAEIIGAARELTASALREAAATDSADSFPVETFAALAREGIAQSVFPTKFGGGGLGIEGMTTVQLLTLLKILGYGNLVAGRVFEGHFNAAQLICEYGTERQIEFFSGGALTENHLFGVWNTEAGDGVKILPTEAGKFRLEGAKTFATGVGFVTRPIVTGRLPEGGWQMFVAPLDEIETKIDNSWWKPIGMRSSRSFRVDFTGVELDGNYLIGEPDDYYRQPFFGGGAIRFAAVQLGAAELLFDLTRQFLRELGRAGDAFQQTRLGEMAIAVESGNLLMEKSARIFDAYLLDKTDSAIERTLNYAGIFRTAIERICQDTMISAERSIGSRGLMQPYHFERAIRDLKMYLRQAAPDAALAGVGKYVLENETPGGEIWRDDENQ